MNPKRHSESLGNFGNNVVPFSAKGFVFPKSVRRSTDFQNDCPGFETVRPDFWKPSPNLATASPNFRAVRPISKTTAPVLKTIRPVSADAPPNLKASPPIFGVFPRFCQPFPRFFGHRKQFGNACFTAICTWTAATYRRFQSADTSAHSKTFNHQLSTLN
jgi:hypothetical protein